MADVSVLSITIKTAVQASADKYGNTGRFSIGKISKNALGVRDGDKVLLTIETESGTILFKGEKKLISGEEIYDTKAESDFKLLSARQVIIVKIEKIQKKP
jgi:hypothetical protein